MTSKTLSTLAAGMLILATLTTGAGGVRAALAPGTIAELRKKASEVLRIEVLDRTLGKANGETQDVVYEVKVTGVVRSASGLKAGGKVKIQAHIRNPNFSGVPKPGPKPPKLLAPGWRGTAYLKAAPNGAGLKLAAFGHSFVKADEAEKRKPDK